MNKIVKINTCYCDDLQMGKKNVKTHTVCCNQVYDGNNIFTVDHWKHEDNPGDESTIEQLERENEEKQSMIDRLTQENNSKQTTIEQLERENDGKDYTIEQLERENEEKQTTINQLDNEAEESKTTIEQLQRENETKQNNIEQLQQENETKQNNIEQLQQEIETNKPSITFTDFSLGVSCNGKYKTLDNSTIDFPLKCDLKPLTLDEINKIFTDIEPNDGLFVLLLQEKPLFEQILFFYTDKEDNVKSKIVELTESNEPIYWLYHYAFPKSGQLEEGEYYSRGRLYNNHFIYKLNKYMTFENGCTQISTPEVALPDQYTSINVFDSNLK